MHAENQLTNIENQRKLADPQNATTKLTAKLNSNDKSFSVAFLLSQRGVAVCTHVKMTELARHCQRKECQRPG
jgi:hypothetical protein